MRRGEIWTVAGGKNYAGKPRLSSCRTITSTPRASITICAFTTGPDRGPPVPPADRAERKQRAADAVPPDGPDHHGSESEDRLSGASMTKPSCD
jgi:hypothetical protein